MLKKMLISAFMSAAFFVGLAETGQAAIINPNPALLYDDNGATLFSPSSLVLNFSVYDITSTLPADWFSIFGFYYSSNPSILTTVFGAEDIRTVPQSVAIDFGTGTVYDIDDGWSVQSIFTVNPGTNIGFFQYYGNVDPAITPLLQFSEPSLNPGGIKVSAAFQFKSDPNMFLMGFEEPISNTLLSYNILGGVTPVNAVPEPSTLLLLGSGAGMLGFFNRKRLSSWIKNRS